MPQSARIEQLTREGVIALNKIWDDEGWTNVGIVEEMRTHGEQTSESTVQKLRRKGAENNSYNYNLTIKPMLRVFARISNEPVSVSEADTPEEVQIATLNNTILMRETDIKLLNAQNAVLEEKNLELKRQLAEVKDEAQRKIKHLVEQIAEQKIILDDRKGFMDERADYLRRKDRAISVLGIALTIMTMIAFFALGSDAIIPLF